jgi:3-oxoacyl-(acyl-carrier-protein) synthase
MSGAKLTLAFSRDTSKTDINVIAQGADEAGGPWSTLAQSTSGSAFTPVAAGATATESATGAVRTVQVGDSYTLPDNNHPKRFLRVTAQH